MKKLFLMGRSEAGKTSLTQILSGEELHYHKTQYTNTGTDIIDSPGEYSETKRCGLGLACFSFEADVLALLMAADEPFSVFEANCQCFTNRPLIGIITKIDSPYANVPMVRNWMVNSGCERIFEVSNPLPGRAFRSCWTICRRTLSELTLEQAKCAAAPRPDGVEDASRFRAGLTAPERRLPRRAVRSAAAALRRRLARG
ncbi:MAG: EutP/PduV family microcompartment system protein [Flavonifractor plautii]